MPQTHEAITVILRRLFLSLPVAAAFVRARTSSGFGGRRGRTATTLIATIGDVGK